MAERDPTTTIQHKGEFHCSLDIDDGHGIGFLTCLVSVFEPFFLGILSLCTQLYYYPVLCPESTLQSLTLY